jgi:hypothetical protein
LIVKTIDARYTLSTESVTVSDLINHDRSFIRDPRDLLRRLQTERPVSPVLMWDAVPVWPVNRYSEAMALLNDSRPSKNRVEANSLTRDVCGVFVEQHGDEIGDLGSGARVHASSAACAARM